MLFRYSIFVSGAKTSFVTSKVDQFKSERPNWEKSRDNLHSSCTKRDKGFFKSSEIVFVIKKKKEKGWWKPFSRGSKFPLVTFLKSRTTVKQKIIARLRNSILRLPVDSWKSGLMSSWRLGSPCVWVADYPAVLWR